MADPTVARARATIDGRDKITVAEAVACFGRVDPMVLGDYGLTADEAGMVDSEAVMDEVPRRAARRRKQRRPLYDARTSLRRVDANAWSVHLPWGQKLGQIEVVYYGVGALASPAPTLGLWKARWDADEPGMEFVTAAVSARAAQALLVRHVAPKLILPAWASNVRDMNHAGGLLCQKVSDAKAWIARFDGKSSVGAVARAEASIEHAKTVGLPPDDISEGMVLTQWEVEEITPTLNPQAERYRDALARFGLEEAERELWKPGEIRTPLGILAQSPGNPKQRERWSIKGVAAFLSDTRERPVKDSTVRAYLARGQMPAEDGRDENGSPWWRPETIEAWEAQRPGRGRWGRRR